MTEPLRIGSQIKCLANLLMREIGNCACEKSKDEATGNNMFIIRYLARRKNEDVFQKDLEEIFSVRRSTMSNIVLRMEQKGFLIREPVSCDRRLKKLVLTEKGENLHIMMESIVFQTEEKLTAGFSEEEKETLSRLLEKLRCNLESDIRNGM
ncbi:MAG: MarR family transcriptional regulator [Clostridia bacterium]|nr:MarR family transcriptional regulator [Clostridia bacterium]